MYAYDDAYRQLAQRIIEVLTYSKEEPYIDQPTAVSVLKPLLGDIKSQIKFLEQNSWFRKADKDKDTCLNLDDLTAYLNEVGISTVKDRFWSLLEINAAEHKEAHPEPQKPIVLTEVSKLVENY